VYDQPRMSDPPSGSEQYRLLPSRVRRGDSTVLQDLHAEIDGRLVNADETSEVVSQAEVAAIRLVSGGDPTVAHSLRSQIEDLKATLGREQSSTLERLLIDRIAVSWLEVEHADVNAAAQTDVHPTMGRFLVARQDAAHRRHRAAITALSTVRRHLEGNSSKSEKSAPSNPVKRAGPNAVRETNAPTPGPTVDPGPRVLVLPAPSDSRLLTSQKPRTPRRDYSGKESN
jgi:hypothetical protein